VVAEHDTVWRWSYASLAGSIELQTLLSGVMSEEVENAGVICRICGLPVIPELSPTDQDGHPVHERCYASVTVSEILVEPAEPEK